MLANYTNEDQTDWDRYLQLVLFAYRTSYQTSLRSTPFGLLYGREARLPLDVVWLDDDGAPYGRQSYTTQLLDSLHSRRQWARGHMDAVQQRRAAVAAGEIQPRVRTSLTHRVFAPGDIVMLHRPEKSKDGLTAKLRHKWKGPYSVVEQVGSATYRLAAHPSIAVGDTRIDHPVAHASRLKPGSLPPLPTYSPRYSLAELEPYLGEPWTTEHNNACELCTKGGGLMVCNWCNVVYHPECVSSLPPDWQDPLAKWACPMCWQEAAEAADLAQHQGDTTGSSRVVAL